MFFNKKGFTLIELIVVVIIIGILAAIAAPMMQGNIKKARESEAIAALGMIRTMERLFFVEHGVYAKVDTGSWDMNYLPGITSNDLSGTWYDGNAYGVSASGTKLMAIYAEPSLSTAPRHEEISGYSVIQMDKNGNITYH